MVIYSFVIYEFSYRVRVRRFVSDSSDVLIDSDVLIFGLLGSHICSDCGGVLFFVLYMQV